MAACVRFIVVVEVVVVWFIKVRVLAELSVKQVSRIVRETHANKFNLTLSR